ncbi:MAG: STAS domain-containing protein [Sinobacteraceae bacterium]|nr:STAS domain-containing protein [Nevskiaceae bacterium]
MTKRQNPAGSGARRTASRKRARKAIAAGNDPAAACQYIFAAESLISDAAEFKSALTPLVSAASVVMLDASALQRIDGAALQLLCAFVRERRSHGRATEWRAVPAALRQAAGLLGLASELGLPQAEGA